MLRICVLQMTYLALAYTDDARSRLFLLRRSLDSAISIVQGLQA